jgi:DNA/RNA-binding domain of Phe-tRNA-synthetase-like protein
VACILRILGVGPQIGSLKKEETVPRLRLDPALAQRFPEYSALIIYARDLANGPSDTASVDTLRAAESAARTAFGTNKPATHPHIAAWRQAYAAFGAKPSKFPCSVEALLDRTLKGRDLPAINQIVDRYNAVSLASVLPIGGEDLDRLDGDLILTVADGTEPWETMHEGQEIIAHPEPGEIVWRDNAGVTCRRWNWRQGLRTQLTERTTNAYFVLDRLPPYPLADLHQAGAALQEHLRTTSPGCQIEVELLGARE